MAHLWVQGPDGWGVRPLSRDQRTLERPPAYARTHPHLSWNRRQMAQDALHFWPGPEGTWYLWTTNVHVMLNGEPVTGGVPLVDRDVIEIVGDVRMLFARETPPRVRPFRDHAVACARCGEPMRRDEDAVACPACGAWHHQSSASCWTCQPTCGVCDQATPLDAGWPWLPDSTEPGP